MATRTGSCVLCCALLLLGCGGSEDADAGVRDAAVAEAGSRDAGLSDAGLSDAGLGDAGADDGGVPTDGGVDGGLADGGLMEDAGSGLVPLPEPPEPVFDDVIDTVSIAVRTADVTNAGTDSPVEVCLNPTTCFVLDTPDVNDRRRGIVDALHFEGLSLRREDVTEVTVRTRSPLDTDNDRWTPACMELRFDGEPVYCNDALGVHIGTGASTDEVPSYTDPEGLHEACTTCWPSTLTHGPVQGAHETDRARLWVRADASRVVGVRMSEGLMTESSPVVAWAVPEPAEDFTTHFELGGLEPGTTYTYRVEVDGDRSEPVHTLRTAPGDDSIERMRFAIGSCTRYEAQPTVAALHATSPDLFLFLGDIHYANSRHQDAHRWNYRLFRGIPERAALLAEVPTLASWDDHDFVGNNSNGTCEGRDEAARAFTEYWANPSAGDGVTSGVFFRHRFGPVEVFALDCRMHRPDVGDTGRRCDVDPSPPSLPLSSGPLGAAQTAWALDALGSSTAPFKLITCGSRFNPNGSADSWANEDFDDARNAFFDALAERDIEGVVLLTGDIHRSEVRRVRRSTGYDLTELTSSPLANSVSNCQDPSALDPDVAADIRSCVDVETSFITVDVEPARADPRLIVRVHGADGGVRHEETILLSDLRGG